MTRTKLRGVASVAALAVGCMVAPAMAQTAADGAEAPDQLQDIVVTARKVSENVQRVPIAITAYSGAELAKQNVRTLPEVATLTPGLQFAPAQTNTAAVLIQMRGQLQQDTLATVDPSVGTYVDGIYWARAYGLTASLVDVANFQALKGPQGTLFGRNTTGGAVLINTNDPSFTDGLSGSLSGTYGRFNQQSLTGVLNVPVIEDKIAARFVYSGNRRDGYVREVNSGRMIGNLNDYTVRAKVLIKPTDTFKLLLSADKFHTDTFIDPGRLGYFSPNGFASLEAGLESLGAAGCFADQAACVGAGNAILARDVTLRQDQFNASLSSTPHSVLTSQTYSATATLSTSFGEVKAIGGYRKTDSVLTDTDDDASSARILYAGGVSQYGLYNAQVMEQWSGELTVTGKALDNRLDYAAGGFLFHEFGHDDTPSSTLIEVSKLSPDNAGRRSITSYYGQVDTKSIGFYSQATYHATDKLSITGGIRWSRDKRSLVSSGGTYFVNADNSLAFTCAFPQCPAARGASFSGVAYTASVDYRATDDVLVYLKTAKGFRSGGLALRGVAAVPASLLPFQPEVVYSYEGGVKSELFNRRLRINLAAYYTHTKDAQRSTAVVGANNTIATVISNAGVVDVYGAELDATALLGHGFQISATAGYTKPKYVSFIDYNGVDRSHEPFPLTPRWTATVSPQWSGDIGENKLSLRADFAYQSSQYNYPQGFYQDNSGTWRDSATGQAASATDAAGYNDATTDKAHVLVNANATLTVLDGKLDLTLWGKNLTNLTDFQNSLTIPGLQMGRVMLREPRTYGLTAKVSF
ncbi:TonB-dependent receptor [Sphingobium sp. sgz301303]|uniref:TonB-dependent receptor n=2 Tax=unclassified Sphingobium TaxID=2611147 RepID=UPI0035A7B97B